MQIEIKIQLFTQIDNHVTSRIYKQFKSATNKNKTVAITCQVYEC